MALYPDANPQLVGDAREGVSANGMGKVGITN